MKMRSRVYKNSRDLLDSVDGIVWEADAQTLQYTFVSKQAETLLGYPVEQWISEPDFLKNHLYADDLQRVLTSRATLITDGLPCEIDYRLVAADGNAKWFRDRVTAICQNGAPARLCGVLIDTTQRKLEEEAGQAALSSARCLIWHGTVDRWEGGYTWSIAVQNETAAQQFLPLEVQPGQTYSDAWYRSKLPEDRVLMDRISAEALQSGRSRYSQAFRCRNREGQIRWLFEDVHVVLWESGRWYVVGVCTDITDRKLAEEHVQRERNFVSAILDTAGALVVVLDPQGHIVRFNRACERVTCYSVEEVQGASFWQRFLTPEEITSFQDLIRQIGTRRAAVEHEGQLLTRDGSRRVIAWATTALLDERGTMEFIICTGIDITERKQFEQQIAAQMEAIQAYSTKLHLQKQELEAANAKLADLATTDGLTGLKNHRAFQEFLEREVRRAGRYGVPLSLLLLDVDRFKEFNDLYGHPAGDRVLKTVAQILQQNARATDFVARYGGEEFAVLLPNTDRIGAMTMAERFRAAIEGAGWQERLITASFGAATAEFVEMTGDQLIVATDTALYYAKRAGRNRVIHAYDEAAKRAA